MLRIEMKHGEFKYIVEQYQKALKIQIAFYWRKHYLQPFLLTYLKLIKLMSFCLLFSFLCKWQQSTQNLFELTVVYNFYVIFISNVIIQLCQYRFHLFSQQFKQCISIILHSSY